MCSHAQSGPCTCTQTCVVHRLTYVYMYTHALIPAHVQINTLTSMCTCKYTPTHTHTFSYRYTHIYLHTGTHTYSEMHACTTSLTHTHTHTHTPAELQAVGEGTRPVHPCGSHPGCGQGAREPEQSVSSPMLPCQLPGELCPAQGWEGRARADVLPAPRSGRPNLGAHA